MCGIVGYQRLGIETNLVLGRDALLHRGPDSSGQFQDNKMGVGLAHTRLSILDLSPLGNQPMFDENRHAALVFNGEIYNFRELREQLENEGCIFFSNSDTEVLLKLYLLKGDKMLSSLDGIFAFAIWDTRNEEMFVARDALGVKPLYYSVDGKGFSFSSEIKSLLQTTPISKELDYKSIESYLTYLWCPGERTPLLNVKKLKPGHALSIKNGIIKRQWNWYKLPVKPSSEKKTQYTSILKETEVCLRKAIHKQLISDVPVGAFLSGGLDSSSIVCFAKELAPKIECFTIKTGGDVEKGVVDDLPYARKAAKHLNVPLNIVEIESSKMANDLEDMIFQLDEPLADPAPLNVLYISKLAKRGGIKVLLSGTGGDDLFSGYRRHKALSLEKWKKWLPIQMRHYLESKSADMRKDLPFLRRLAKLLSGASLSGDDSLIQYFRWTSRNDLLPLFSDAIKSEIFNHKAENAMLEYLKTLPTDLSQLEKMLALEKRFFLSDHNLLYTDKMSMAAGVEVRVPFLDQGLIEFASQIPDRYKLRFGQEKWILKKVMERYLPRNLIYRTKTGFGAPVRRWIKNELNEFVNDTLSEKSLRERNLFDGKKVNKLIKLNKEGKIDASYTIFSLICIEIWCRKFLDTNHFSSPDII